MTNLKTLKELLSQKSLDQNDLLNVKGGNGDSLFSVEKFSRRFKPPGFTSNSPSGNGSNSDRNFGEERELGGSPRRGIY